MTVVLLLGMLAAIAIPMFAGNSRRTAAVACLATRTIIERSAQSYVSKEGTRPVAIDSLVGSYVLATPKCPSLGTYVWLRAESTVLCSIHYAGDSAALWTSDWSSSSLLRTLSGTWAASNGLLTATTASQALFTGAVPDDFIMQATLVTLNSGQGYGFYFRSTANADGQVSGYCFQYDPGLGDKFVVRTVLNGHESAPIAQASMPAGYAVYGTSRNVTITAIGAHTVIKVDGVTVLDFADSTFASGQVGLRSWGSGTSVSIGGVSVSSAIP
jgi:hypothetical protein